MSIAQEFKRLLDRRYPNLTGLPENLDWSVMLCPAVVAIRHHTLDIIRAAIRAFYALRQLPAYQAALSSPADEISRFDPGNRSVLMGYDFHITEEGAPYLIEINTNAAFSLGADLLNASQGVANPFAADFPLTLQADFKQEYALLRPAASLHTVAIIDENYQQQNFYFEFLMFKALFESWGWQCLLGDPADFVHDETQHCLRHRSGTVVDLVYNRLTDFQFADERHRHLRRAYLARHACFTPNPREYHLLADKQRLVDISAQGWLEKLGVSDEIKAAIRAVLPTTIAMAQHADPEQLWRERKQLFFKPKQSHGGKGVYRGATISRKMFDSLQGLSYIAQQYIPPGKLRLATSSGTDEEFKYDVRFYVYEDTIQLMIARVYQGQVTNLRTAGGGFASVRVEAKQ